MNAQQESTQIVKAFFNAFGSGDLEGILNSFHEDCTIIGIRSGERQGKDIYGSYRRIEGVKEFLGVMINTFDTKAFQVENILGEGNIAFANGSFTHQVKATGKLFSSDWALMCVVKDGKIFEHHFYEDSEKYAQASQ